MFFYSNRSFLYILLIGFHLAFSPIICQNFDFISFLDETNHSLIAGFGDFNADKNVDIFTISNQGQNVNVLLADDIGHFKERNLIKGDASSSTSTYISGILLSDFDGDGQMDVAILRKAISMTLQPMDLSVEVYWGNLKNLTLTDPIVIDSNLENEPVLFDYNADLIPDLLFEYKNGTHLVWIAQYKKRIFRSIDFSLFQHLSLPHSSAFLPIISGTNADLVLMLQNNEFMIFENNRYSNPSKMYTSREQVIGQSVFADLNQDGHLEHILPVRTEKGDAIQVYFNQTWIKIYDLSSNGLTFNFTNTLRLSGSRNYLLPTTLVIGDYNSDGNPDMLTIVNKNGRLQPILFKNVECVPSIIIPCQSYGRMLELQANALPVINEDIYLAVFFDIGETGSLDILLTLKNQSSGHQLSTFTLKNNIATDTCFMKVTVSSGLCDSICEGGNKPHAVNSPGTIVKYKMKKLDGKDQISCAAQSGQSAYFALQLPYVLFGLGQTPNFIDSLEVFIPRPFNSNKLRSREWTQIIPNSQLLVNPNPLDNPTLWTMRLFVMPSKQIYTTAIVLASVCVGLGILVAILLFLEKQEDKIEKKQESQKFHFDAM